MTQRYHSCRPHIRKRRQAYLSRASGQLLYACLITVLCYLPANAQSAATDEDATRSGTPYIYPNPYAGNRIRVGVREDAEPFSYLKPSRADNHVLPRFSGYIVEICRTVLRQIVANDVFWNYQIVPVPVKASDRFDKLANREVDLLCGPDSITTERLRLYNVSHPVFLSGIARVKLPIDRMPRSKYCQQILGLVAGTTSEQAGIQAMVRSGQFGRFTSAIKQYLTYKAGQKEPEPKSTLLVGWNTFADSPKIGHENRLPGASHAGNDDVTSGTIKTKECPSGYTSGPVVTYDSHAVGLQDLCAGKILYYLGDVDIVKRNLGTGCDHLEFSQQTFTKEAYGVYFRKPPRVAYEALDSEEQLDAVLYAEFNRLLVLQMQSAERLLENQYREEFGNAEMAADLQMFFSSMQYATDY